MCVPSLVSIDPLTFLKHCLLQLNVCAEFGSASEFMTYGGIERCILLSLLLNVCTKFGSDRPLDLPKIFPRSTECDQPSLLADCKEYTRTHAHTAKDYKMMHCLHCHRVLCNSPVYRTLH